MKSFVKNKNLLAPRGGNKISRFKFNRYNSIGKEELAAAIKVIKSGHLSSFVGSWPSSDGRSSFYGGQKVLEFEKSICKFFNVKYAITVNSWTSGLIIAVGALDIEPGDEIIVSPWTMCASATCIINWLAIPIFADINKDTFNLDPDDVEKKITKRTKAIILPDIFGHPADIEKFLRIKKKYNLKIISDNAQSIGAKFKNKYVGNFFDMGGFSFNHHKHINTGEGGVVVTNLKKYAERLKLLRNHGEAVVEKRNIKKINNIIGNNFRLGEIECAIGIEQLKKLKKIIYFRQNLANIISSHLSKLKGLILPVIKKNYTHSFYYYGMRIDTKLIKTTKKKIVEALKAEGVPIRGKYENIHLLPMFKRKIAFGSSGLPWKLNSNNLKIIYKKGICPNAESINKEEYLGIPLFDYDFNDKNILVIVDAFKKIWKNFIKFK
jgi:dTDP-4-amino-4,6-dideoxygalactose transaminase